MATHNDDDSPQSPKAIKLQSLQPTFAVDTAVAENAATQQEEEMKEVPLSEAYKKRNDCEAAEQLQEKVLENNDCEAAGQFQEEITNVENKNGEEIPNTNDFVSNCEEVVKCNLSHEVVLNNTNTASNCEEKLDIIEKFSNSNQEELPIEKNHNENATHVKSPNVEMQKKDRFDPITHLPTDYDSLSYECCQSCSCGCPSFCGCLARANCASCNYCDECADGVKLPDTESIRKARLIGVTILKNVIFRNLFHIAVIREIIVYVALILTLVSIGTSIKDLYDATQSSERQIKKTFTYISFGISMFGLPFTILDGIIRFRHHGCRVAKRAWKKEEFNQEGDEENAEFCNDSCACEGICGKSCVVFMDITRIFVLETIFYPNLLLQVFPFIMLLVDNDYAPKMIPPIKWVNAAKGFLTILVFVYLQKAYVFGGIIVSVRKLGKKDKESTSEEHRGSLFIILFVLYTYGLMILQILMIIIIGARFHYEYADNRAIEMSGQLWYMIIFTYIMPLLGILMYFVVHHFWTMTLPVDVVFDLVTKLQSKGKQSKKLEELKNEVGENFQTDYSQFEEVPFWKKFIYPFTSPFHAVLIGFYGLLFLGFFLCCTLDAPYGIWTWFYVAAGGLTVILNIYATSITFVWVMGFIGIVTAIAVVTAATIAVIALIIACILVIIILILMLTAYCTSNKN